MEYFKVNLFILTLWFLILNLGNHLLAANSEVNSTALVSDDPKVHPLLTLVKILAPLNTTLKHLNSKADFEATIEEESIGNAGLESYNSSIKNSNITKRIKRRAFLIRALMPLGRAVQAPLSKSVIKSSTSIRTAQLLRPLPYTPVKSGISGIPVTNAIRPVTQYKPLIPYSPSFHPVAVKPPSIRPPPYSPISPKKSKPPIFMPATPTINPISLIFPSRPISPSAVKPKPIQRPHITPDSKGTYRLTPIVAAASTTTLLTRPQTSSNFDFGLLPNQPSTNARNSPTCILPPQIQNGDVSHCAGTKAGHRCRMMCQRNYEPNVKSIQCVRKSSSQAEWQLNAARCDYNVDPVCRDNFNRKVDWFVAYRVPKSFNGKTDSHLFISNLSPDRMDFQTDAEFNSFHDGNSWTDWIFDQGLLGTGKNAVGHTLSVLRQISSGGTGGSWATLKHALYSDQPPPSGYAPHYYGHSKGVLVHSNTGRGFYMVHTQPKFPGVPGTSSAYSLAKGQIFVCVTLSSNVAISEAILHVTNLHPKKYSGDVNLGTPGMTSYSGLNEISLISQLGTTFKLFSKSRARGDIYRLIADTYGSDVFVQSWRNGAGTKLPSDCPVGGKKVQNVELMKFSADTKDTTGWNLFGTWKRTTDHAKWMVGQDRNDNLFCTGDMNRMQSQEGRWGGAICLSDRRVARAFRQLIEEIEPCPGTSGSMLSSTSWASG